MPQSPADRLINRISALHRSLQLDEGGKLSTMERDLMLGYLRELYEIYATHQEGKPYTPPPVATPPPVKATPPPSPAPKPAPAPKPEPAPAPPPRPVTPPAPVTPPPPAVTPNPLSTASTPDMRALFADDGPSSRFGRQPLADLNKGLTINTRILFSRELFGDDNELLNTSLRTLNSSGSFAAAQPVLETMARRFDWPAEGRLETAREFIELVRRRYV